MATANAQGIVCFFIDLLGYCALMQPANNGPDVSEREQGI